MNSTFTHLLSKFHALMTASVMVLVGVTSIHDVQAQPAAAPTSAYAEVEKTGSVTEPLGATYVKPKALDAKVVRATFYRPSQGQSAGVSSLQINGHYHVSLQLGGYSEICLPAGRISLAAHMVQTGAPLKDFKDATTALPTTAGSNLYFRVNEQGDNRATITPVNAEIALPELQNTRQQIHAVSRVPETVACAEAEPVVAKTEAIVLGADALFAFGKSDIKGISAQGRTALDQLVARLQKEYGHQEGMQIQVTGHADPLGSSAVNKRLSDARAKAIRTYMVEGGMDGKKITASGAGSEQPVITTCGKTATPETIECNKPNRRVVVDVQVMAR